MGRFLNGRLTMVPVFILAALAGSVVQSLPSATFISPAERVAAARAAGFRTQGTRLINECDAVAEMIAFERQDLNADGAPEMIVTDGGACYGNGGSMFVVLRRLNGQWQPVLSAHGIMNILKTRRSGWADIEIGGPGFGQMPVARWNGTKYDY